jgi:hypothetical protein
MALTLPNTLVNGTVADAVPVMANFNAIVTYVNLPNAMFGTQAANKVYGGPISGAAALPGFRSLVSADLPAYATASATPANPTGTTTAGRMMGLGSVITPTATGKLLVIHNGIMSNDTSGSGASVTLRYGSGTPPVNGAALTGTIVGNNPQFFAPAAGATEDFSIAWTITGLTIGTAYWIDLGLGILGAASTAAVTALGFTAVELQ